MTDNKAFKAFINIIAFLNSKLFLAIWISMIAINYFIHNPFSGALILGATWVIDLVVIGELKDSEGIYFFLLILFPAIFTFVPIRICQFFYRRFGVRHVNQ